MADENRRSVTLGIVLVILTYFVFSFHDATIKWLTATTTVWQILFIRSLTIFSGCLIFGRSKGLQAAVSSPLKVALIIRAFMILGAWTCFYSASKYLQLAELTTIYFCSPVLITLLAVPILKEKITLARWIAVVMGFVGVLVAVRPMSFGFSTATILALIAAFLWAGSNVLVRKISMSAGTYLQMFYSSALFSVITGFTAIFYWQPVTFDQFGLLLLVGVLGGAGQMLFFESLRRAPASLLAPFEYTALIWAFILGYLVWQDVPHTAVFIGAGLIITSGFVVLVFDRQPRNEL